jgi:hypothetical protein
LRVTAVRRATFVRGDTDGDRENTRSKTMTDEQLATVHRLLAEHHRNLANEAALDVVQRYHSELAQRLAPATRRREPAVFIARIERNNERAL